MSEELAACNKLFTTRSISGGTAVVRTKRDRRVRPGLAASGTLRGGSLTVHGIVLKGLEDFVTEVYDAAT
ncbi:hypothetical protein [Halopiger thermotolerans]